MSQIEFITALPERQLLIRKNISLDEGLTKIFLGCSNQYRDPIMKTNPGAVVVMSDNKFYSEKLGFSSLLANVYLEKYLAEEDLREIGKGRIEQLTTDFLRIYDAFGMYQYVCNNMN